MSSMIGTLSRSGDSVLSSRTTLRETIRSPVERNAASVRQLALAVLVNYLGNRANFSAKQLYFEEGMPMVGMAPDLAIPETRSIPLSISLTVRSPPTIILSLDRGGRVFNQSCARNQVGSRSDRRSALGTPWPAELFDCVLLA